MSPTCLVLRRLGFLALCLLAGALVGAGLGQLLGSVGQHAGSWLVGAEIGAVAGVWLGALRLG